jgi:hypothetical protein
MGESRLGATFAQHLTAMIFEQLRGAGVDAVLLNPGGLYSATPDAEILEYARNNNATVGLIAVVLNEDIPASGDYIVTVETKLVNTQSGDVMATWQSTAPISRHELINNAVKTYSPDAAGRVAGVYGSSAANAAILMSSDTKAFEKQAVGKTAAKLAEDIRNQATHAVPATGSKPAAGSGSCKVTFKVGYPRGISKAYDVVINGKNESLNVVDGYVPVNLQAGPVMVLVSVHDPKRMPAQDVYQANTIATCAPDQTVLVLQLDQIGSAMLKWQQE